MLQVDANVQTDELRQRMTSLQRHVQYFSSESGIDPPRQGSRGSSPERLRPQQAPLLDRMARLEAELQAATAAAEKSKACSAVFQCCSRQSLMRRCQPNLQLLSVTCTGISHAFRHAQGRPDHGLHCTLVHSC